jgi:hypothetical protein
LAEKNPLLYCAALFWFGLRDVGILYSQAIIFGAEFSEKDRRFEHMQAVIQTSRRLDSFLHEVAKNFKLL